MAIFFSHVNVKRVWMWTWRYRCYPSRKWTSTICGTIRKGCHVCECEACVNVKRVWMWNVCECEARVNVNLTLPVLTSTEINKLNMRYYSMRLVLIGRGNACWRARCVSPQKTYGMSYSFDRHRRRSSFLGTSVLFMNVITESHNTRFYSFPWWVTPVVSSSHSHTLHIHTHTHMDNLFEVETEEAEEESDGVRDLLSTHSSWLRMWKKYCNNFVPSFIPICWVKDIDLTSVSLLEIRWFAKRATTRFSTVGTPCPLFISTVGLLL